MPMNTFGHQAVHVGNVSRRDPLQIQLRERDTATGTSWIDFRLAPRRYDDLFDYTCAGLRRFGRDGGHAWRRGPCKQRKGRRRHRYQ